MKHLLCEECSRNDGSPKTQVPKINVDINNVTAEKLLAEVNSKLEIIYGMQQKIVELTDTVDFYAEQYQKMTEFKEVTEKKIRSLENKNVNLQKINAVLEEKVTAMELKEVEKNIEISGVEILKDENDKEIKKVVEIIAKKLDLKDEDIEEVKRVGREKNQENRSRPILVTLASIEAKKAWLLKKKTGLINSDIITNGNTDRLYINDCLTKHMRNIFWSTRTTLKGIFKYIWVQEGRILVRKKTAQRYII